MRGDGVVDVLSSNNLLEMDRQVRRLLVDRQMLVADLAPPKQLVEKMGRAGGRAPCTLSKSSNHSNTQITEYPNPARHERTKN